MLRKEPRNTEAPHINIQSPKKTSQHIKFSHKKKYCGFKDIRVLFYSSIFQMIIVFPFIVLKYFSFCCHFFHSVLCCNRLVYSCFILFVKSDSNFNRNSSCLLSILFNLFVIHLWLQPVFFLIPCLYSYYFSCYFVFVSFFFSCYSVFSFYSVFPLTLSLYIFLCYSVSLLLCLYTFCLSCYSVFMSFYFSLSFCLFSCFCRTSSPPIFLFILASFSPFHLFIF